ncbi:hypothetical protein M5D96_001979 [Drosophila gunungcola]|uniref:Uncharacterized protein n=1 Tax=Drosophila gunungcola TaxID=103775 RepID=A0A9P9YZ15_9MUSC|nr:hypothetical protein M5D96_001979 [Drosophila gunungcola]
MCHSGHLTRARLPQGPGHKIAFSSSLTRGPLTELVDKKSLVTLDVIIYLYVVWLLVNL